MRYLLVLALACSTLADDEIVAEAKKLSVADHAELVRKLRVALHDRLLKPDAQLAGRQPKGVSINRILNRGLFKHELGVRGGGAYFSFVTKQNDYDKVPNLELQEWKFMSGFHGGDHGFVQLLQVAALKDANMEVVPALFKMPAGQFYRASRARESELWREQRKKDAQGPRPGPYPKAEAGRVYVVRSMDWGTTDVLVAFEVLAVDEFGATFAWRTLRKFPNPGRRP